MIKLNSVPDADEARRLSKNHSFSAKAKFIESLLNKIQYACENNKYEVDVSVEDLNRFEDVKDDIERKGYSITRSTGGAYYIISWSKEKV